MRLQLVISFRQRRCCFGSWWSVCFHRSQLEDPPFGIFIYLLPLCTVHSSQHQFGVSLVRHNWAFQRWVNDSSKSRWTKDEFHLLSEGIFRVILQGSAPRRRGFARMVQTVNETCLKRKFQRVEDCRAGCCVTFVNVSPGMVCGSFCASFLQPPWCVFARRAPHIRNSLFFFLFCFFGLRCLHVLVAPHTEYKISCVSYISRSSYPLLKGCSFQPASTQRAPSPT